MAEPRRRRTAYAASVLRTEDLSGSMVRVVVGGPGLSGFEASPFADSYVKVVFVHPDAPRPLPRTDDGRVDVDAVKEALPAEHAPRLRSYTVRTFDEDKRELTLDFVVHGDATNPLSPGPPTTTRTNDPERSSVRSTLAA